MLTDHSEFPFINIAFYFIDPTFHWTGVVILAIFFLAYIVVMSEEVLHLRKSKPVIVAAGIIWALIAIEYTRQGNVELAGKALRHNLEEFAELFLFLLSAMTYVNTMEERGLFDALRVWLISKRFSFKILFWITGVMAFSLSPIIDNLTTALVMGAVVLSVGKGNPSFITLGYINIVVAANAGGAFSPFGDITTLMVWQKGMVAFFEFFKLFVPSFVNWFLPAFIISFGIKKAKPEQYQEDVVIKPGAFTIVFLFVLTIIMAVLSHGMLHLPPVIGMMTGLGLLKFYGYYLRRKTESKSSASRQAFSEHQPLSEFEETQAQPQEPFDVFKSLQKVKWDTLMFFYGIIMCVGGLGAAGYLNLASRWLYADLGPMTANILIGILSAFIDNIPLMFAVLSMNPELSHNQWLLVTLTLGVGGSLLSIGSAAGVALMGQAGKHYTFFSHLKWTWAIALGYAASIIAHIFINGK